jgi:zinc-ribbon domain
MALKPCRECGARVSTDAEVCPHCGVRFPTAADPVAKLDPKAQKPWARYVGSIAVIIIATVLWFNFIAVPEKNTPTNPTCENDWTKCADNEQLVNKFSDWFRVKAACACHLGVCHRTKTI